MLPLLVLLLLLLLLLLRLLRLLVPSSGGDGDEPPQNCWYR